MNSQPLVLAEETLHRHRCSRPGQSADQLVEEKSHESKKIGDVGLNGRRRQQPAL